MLESALLSYMYNLFILIKSSIVFDTILLPLISPCFAEALGISNSY